MKASEAMGRLTSVWGAVAPRKRIVVIASAVCVLALLGGWTLLAARPEYVVLFNRLETKDASAIVSALDAQGTPYQLADSGRTVLVPSSVVHSTRLALAGEGLPSLGSPGFELLEGVSIGATDFERRTNYVRALSGELARTISQIEQVDSARVHIVLPEQSLFTSQSKPTTAAVLVHQKPGAALSPEQVQGIVHLVSRSVEGLDPESITVVDQSGRVLQTTGSASRPSLAETATGTLDATRQFSQDLETSLQRMLEQVLGPGNVATRVAAQLSFDQSVIEKKLFEPVADGQGLVRSMQEAYESVQGSIAGADGGGAGVQTNVPIYESPSSGSGGSSQSEKSEVVKNFEINEITEHTVIAPGAVKRLSVSVVVNKELAAAEVASLEKLVAAAVGSDVARNDQIVVTGLAFNTDLAQSIAAGMAIDQRNRLISIGAGAGLAVVLGLVLFLRGRRATKRRRGLEVVVAEEVAPELPANEVARLKAQDDLQRLFRQKPQSAAEVLRSWLVEE